MKLSPLLFALIFLININFGYCQTEESIEKSNISIAPDYNNLYYWAAHPLKKNFSDSLPIGAENDMEVNPVADVFFIHPTTYTQKEYSSLNAYIDDSVINNKTDNSAILYQASVFNNSCRIYAPRYRQAHLSTFFIDSKEAAPYFDLAYSDVKKAFAFYLQNYNHGRPIIIASHSQGTVHAGRLIKEFFEGKPLSKQLICAYLIGMPVPQNYFSELTPCQNKNQTGCFVSWRTFKSGYTPEFVKKEKFKCIVVNPLTWETNNAYAPKKLNKGGVLKNFRKIVPAVVDAQVNNNILWSCKPDVFGKMFFALKNFHIGDINLFYMNIRENAKNRIEQYISAKHTAK